MQKNDRERIRLYSLPVEELIFPQATYGTSTKASLRERMEEEAVNVFVRRAVEVSLPPSGDPSYGQMARMLNFKDFRRMQNNF